MLKVSAFKIIAVFIVLIVGYHFSGAEIAFCKDTVETAPTHSCSIHQHEHHAMNLQQSVEFPSSVPDLHTIISEPFLYSQEVFLNVFRPPIFA